MLTYKIPSAYEITTRYEMITHLDTHFLFPISQEILIRDPAKIVVINDTGYFISDGIIFKISPYQNSENKYTMYAQFPITSDYMKLRYLLGEDFYLH